MPGPGSKEEKKKVEETKKTVHTALKKLGTKVKKDTTKIKELIDEKAELEKKKKPAPDDKKRAKKIDKDLLTIKKACQSDATSASQQINRILQSAVPDDKNALPPWQKGMDKWYIDILNKETGLAIGGGTRVNGSISFEKNEAVITFDWKF